MLLAGHALAQPLVDGNGIAAQLDVDVGSQAWKPVASVLRADDGVVADQHQHHHAAPDASTDASAPTHAHGSGCSSCLMMCGAAVPPEAAAVVPTGPDEIRLLPAPQGFSSAHRARDDRPPIAVA